MNINYRRIRRKYPDIITRRIVCNKLRRIAKITQIGMRKSSVKDQNLNKYDKFENALFDVEHALSMHAVSFCTFTASSIYDDEVINNFNDVIPKCHIYMIGYQPKVEVIKCLQESNVLILRMSIKGEEYDVKFDLPDGAELKEEDDIYYIQLNTGEQVWPDQTLIMKELNYLSNAVNFEVKYIGQSYGKDGSRNAVDRLIKHETLQKISLKGIPEGYRLSLLLLEVQPENMMITMFNPRAKNRDDGEKRIDNGLDKLYSTTEKEFHCMKRL